MKVLFKINCFAIGQPPQKLLDTCAKIFEDFPPEKLPAVGDTLNLPVTLPEALMLSPIVRRRTCIISGRHEFDWVIEAKTNEPGFTHDLKKYEGWHDGSYLPTYWPIY